MNCGPSWNLLNGNPTAVGWRFPGAALIRAFKKRVPFSRIGGGVICGQSASNRRGVHHTTNGRLQPIRCCQIHSTNSVGGFGASRKLIKQRMIHSNSKNFEGDFSDLNFDSVSDPNNPDFDEIKLDEDFYKSMGMTKEEAERSQRFRAEDADPEAERFSLDDLASLAPDIPEYIKEGLSKGVMFGPPTILLAGFLLEELPMVRYIVDAAGGRAAKVVPVTNDMLHKLVEEVVELPEPDWEKPRPDDFMRGGAWGAQRAIVFGGMKVEAQAAVIELLEEGGLPPICPMAATEETKRMKLGELLADAVKYQRFRKNPENDLWKINERATKELPDVENYLEKEIKNRVDAFQEGMERGMVDLEQDEDGILQVKFKKDVVDRYNRGKKTPQQTYEDAVKEWGPEMSEDELREKFGGMDADEMKKMVEELKGGEAFEQWLKDQGADEEATTNEGGDTPDFASMDFDASGSGNQEDEEEGYPEDWEVLETLKQVRADRMAAERESKGGSGDEESSNVNAEPVVPKAVETGGSMGSDKASESPGKAKNAGWVDNGSLELEQEVTVVEQPVDPPRADLKYPPAMEALPMDSTMEPHRAEPNLGTADCEGADVSESGSKAPPNEAQPLENAIESNLAEKIPEKSGQRLAPPKQQPSLDEGVYEGDFFAIDNLVGEELGLDPLKRPKPEPQMSMQEMLELPLGNPETSDETSMTDGGRGGPAGEGKESSGTASSAVEASKADGRAVNPSLKSDEEQQSTKKEVKPPLGTKSNEGKPSGQESTVEVVEADAIFSGEYASQREAEPEVDSSVKIVGKSEVPATTLQEFKEYIKDQKNEIEYVPEVHSSLFEPQMENASDLCEKQSQENTPGKSDAVKAALQNAMESGVNPEELKKMIDDMSKHRSFPKAGQSQVVPPQGGATEERKPAQKQFRSRYSYVDDDRSKQRSGRGISMPSPADIIPIDDQDLEVVEDKLVTQGDWDSVFGRPFYDKPSPSVADPLPKDTPSKINQAQPAEVVGSSPGVDASSRDTENTETLTKSQLAAVAKRQGLDLEDLLADARGRGIHISD